MYVLSNYQMENKNINIKSRESDAWGLVKMKEGMWNLHTRKPDGHVNFQSPIDTLFTFVAIFYNIDSFNKLTNMNKSSYNLT